MPISVEIDKNGPKPPFPFNFNHARLKDEEYKRLVISIWRPLVENVDKYLMH
jgi:hypothetical protein